MTLTVGSLFAGIGGIDLGLERAGMRTLWQVEIDPWCQRVLAKHWPDVERFADVREVGSHNLRPVDLIAGGFPCQDISVAGRGAGLAGARSGLWSEFARIIGELRPRYVLVENVTALLHRGLDVVLGDLAAIGYDAEWDCLSAASVGAPHLRDRVWIVAYPGRRSVQSDRGPGELAGPQRANAGEAQSRAVPAASWDGSSYVEDAEGDGCGARGTRGSAANGEGSDESAESLADANGAGQLQPCRTFTEERGRSGDCGTQLADADRFGWGRRSGQLWQGWRGEPAGGGWWAVEPNVGGTLDGLSAWLDGPRLMVSHELICAYGKAENTGPEEVLRAVRDRVGAPDVRGPSGGSVGVSPASVLLTYLRELARHAEEWHFPLASAEAPPAEVRGVRQDDKPARSPRRRSAVAQRSVKPSDPLRDLSQLLARHAEKAWSAYRWENARPVLATWGPGWEQGIARVSVRVPRRVDRLRGLGNAVVPQVVEWIGRRIVMADFADQHEGKADE